MFMSVEVEEVGTSLIILTIKLVQLVSLRTEIDKKFSGRKIWQAYSSSLFSELIPFSNKIWGVLNFFKYRFSKSVASSISHITHKIKSLFFINPSI